MNKIVRFIALSWLTGTAAISAHAMEKHFVVAQGFQNYPKLETWLDNSPIIYKTYIPWFVAQAQEIDQQLDAKLADPNVDVDDLKEAFMEYAQRIMPINAEGVTSTVGLDLIEAETIVVCKMIYAMLHKIDAACKQQKELTMSLAQGRFLGVKNVLFGLTGTMLAVGTLAYAVQNLDFSIIPLTFFF